MGRKFPGPTGHTTAEAFCCYAPDFVPDGADLCGAHADKIHSFRIARSRRTIWMGYIRPTLLSPLFDLVSVQAVGIGVVPNFVCIFQVQGACWSQLAQSQFSKMTDIAVVGPKWNMHPGVSVQQIGKLKDQFKRRAYSPAGAPECVAGKAAFFPRFCIQVVDDPLPLHEPQHLVMLQRLQHQGMKTNIRIDIHKRLKNTCSAVCCIFSIHKQIVVTDTAGRNQTQIAQMVVGVDIRNTNPQQGVIVARRNPQHISTWRATYLCDEGGKAVIDCCLSFIKDSPLPGRNHARATVEIGQRYMCKSSGWIVAKRNDPAS